MADPRDRLVSIARLVDRFAGCGFDAAFVFLRANLVFHDLDGISDIGGDQRSGDRMTVFQELARAGVHKRAWGENYGLRNGNSIPGRIREQPRQACRTHRNHRCCGKTSQYDKWVKRHGITLPNVNAIKWVLPHARVHSLVGLRYRPTMALGASTCVIRSSSHSPSTVKCAVAPSSTASIRLWFT